MVQAVSSSVNDGGGDVGNHWQQGGRSRQIRCTAVEPLVVVQYVRSTNSAVVHGAVGGSCCNMQ